jgi:hypothetical protein
VGGLDEPGLQRPLVAVCTAAQGNRRMRRAAEGEESEEQQIGQESVDWARVTYLCRGGSRTGEAAARPGSPSSSSLSLSLRFAGGGGARRRREEASGMVERGERGTERERGGGMKRAGNGRPIRGLSGVTFFCLPLYALFLGSKFEF